MRTLPDMLDAEETLIVQVARATCLTYRLDPDTTSQEDVDTYVAELLRLYAVKPHARVLARPGEPALDVSDAVAFCAEQLTEVAPSHATRLRSALLNAN